MIVAVGAGVGIGAGVAVGLGVAVGDGVGLGVTVGAGVGVLVAVGDGLAVAIGDGVGVLRSGVGVNVGAALIPASDSTAVAVAIGSCAEPQAAASRATSASSHARAFTGAHIGSCRMDGAIARVGACPTIPEALAPGHVTGARQPQRNASHDPDHHRHP